ncbi:hypothetical protein V1505DRAFT_402267 [Lipomyces doorenjongii]
MSNLRPTKTSLERHDKHIFNRETQSLKLRVTFSESFVLRSDVSVALCAPNEHRELQIQAASHLRNGIFDCSGYYFHLRRCKERVQRYVQAQQLLAPRLIYQNLIQMADSPQNTELRAITRQQVCNIWLSLTRKGICTAAVGRTGREPGVSLGFITSCFSDKLNTMLDTPGVREVGKRGTRLTAWLTTLRAARLDPNVVHTDKDFPEVTAASLAFKKNNDRYNHHLCLWHSLRAIDQYVTSKIKARALIQVAILRNSTRLKALPQYLLFLLSKQCTRDQDNLVFECFPVHPDPEPSSSSDPSPRPRYRKIMVEYCKSIDQPKLFRLQCYDSNFANDNAIGESLENPKEELRLTIS